MTHSPDAYPLQWPAGIRRTPDQDRRRGSFQVSAASATQSLVDEIARSGGHDVVISSNLPVRRDGLPYANAREPSDPGVAVYFTRKAQLLCVPCDAFDRVWKNIRAVALSIKDIRGPEARGCAVIADQAFTAFVALPPPSIRPWREVLKEHSDDPAKIQAQYKKLAAFYFQNGDQQSLAELNAARDQAKAEGYL